MKRDLGQTLRIVVKIGSAVLAPGGVLDASRVEAIAADILEVLDKDKDRQALVVTSGAVASGFRSLGLAKPPKEIVSKQAAAAIGQPRLMSTWASAFARAGSAGTASGRSVAQVLLTAEDIDHRARFLNARHTLEALLGAGVIPIINENDSVSYAEIKLGDNDHLSSLVSSLVSADLLVILSSVAGVWAPEEVKPGAKAKLPALDGSKASAGGSRRIVRQINSLSDGLELVRIEASDVGTGGMETKIKAACTAAGLGAGVIIANGNEERILSRLLEGEALGTYFPPAHKSQAARKRWIGFSARPKGTLIVDEGAKKAITQRGASLLPTGLRDVEGEFAGGALVDISTRESGAFARGLCAYGSQELLRLRGLKSADISRVLGYSYCPEIVHRDDLALVDAGTLRDVSARRTDS